MGNESSRSEAQNQNQSQYQIKDQSQSSCSSTAHFPRIDNQAIQSSPLADYDYADDEPIKEHIHKTHKTEEKTITKSEIEDSIKLSLRLKKEIIQSRSFNAQTFPMLVSLQVDKLKSSAKAPLDLVCVIDHSGSMSGQKINLVKNTFNFLLNCLGEDDRLSIVIFDHAALRLTRLLRTTEANKRLILSNIKAVEGCGGTNINLGMQHAFKILTQRRYKNPVSSIFLLSDGIDEKAQERVKRSLLEMKVPEDITINTFGFGQDHDPQLMNDIADLRDGNFYFIKELDTIDEAFVNCLGGLLSVVGQNVVIKIKAENSPILKGVEIVKAYGNASMWSKNGNLYITKLSTLITGVQKDFVLELSIPPNSKELKDHEKSLIVASAEADITILDGQHITKKGELIITLINEGEELKEEEEDDKEVMKNFFRLKGALVMTEARKLADENKNEEAKKKLVSFEEELENSFLKNEDFIKNLIKDINQTIINVNPVVYQQAGRHELMENARAQMYQKSNLKSANCYSNEVQQDLILKVKAAKKF